MFGENGRFSFWASLILLVFAMSRMASAGFLLIDDFDSYAPGELDGQTDGSGTWNAGPSMLVDVDQTDPGNQVMDVSDAGGTQDAFLNDDPNLNVANGTQATLFYRFYRGDPTTHVNWGLTDLENPVPASWGGFETQFRDLDAVIDIKIFPPDATFTMIDNIDLLPEEEWINAWVVIDNAADSRELYLQSENAYPDQVKLTSFGDEIYEFQNGTEEALTTFWLRNSSPHRGPWYLDDIYLDPAGENLTNPTLGLAPQLQAGDADMDLDFDQLDLVKVQIAAKYLTGQAATWGEGDWDGAPGGEVGSPPAGNGFFDQLDIITALAPAHYLTGPYAALTLTGTPGDEQTSLVYDATTGELSVDSPASNDLTSINITSAASRFIGDKPTVLDGAFDNFAADNIFKATFGGSFGNISFGNVLPAGISENDVVADLTAVGSLAGGGDLGNVDLIYIPEPSGVTLMGFVVMALLSSKRRL